MAEAGKVLELQNCPTYFDTESGRHFPQSQTLISHFSAYGIPDWEFWRSSYRALVDAATQECQWIRRSHSRCNARCKLDHVAGTFEDAGEVFGMNVRFRAVDKDVGKARTH
jgi:hypothetical protein